MQQRRAPGIAVEHALAAQQRCIWGAVVVSLAVAVKPIAVIALRGRWAALWRARWRVIGMGLIGVAGTQLAYFAAISRIPVSTSLLIEYLAPLILVAIVWIRTRRTPRAAARTWWSMSSIVTGTVSGYPSTTMPSESPTSSSGTPASSSSFAIGKS